MHGFEIIAHRGAVEVAPENTWAAINAAWKQGASAVEIDVRLSKDKQLLVIHDANTFRTAKTNHYVRRITAKRAMRIDVGRWKGERWQGETIPLLSEVLNTLPKKKKLFIDIKQEDDVAPVLIALLHDSNVNLEQVVLLSHSIHLLEQLQQVFPNVSMYLIEVVFFYESSQQWQTIEAVLQRVADAGLSGLSLKFIGDMNNKEFNRTLKKIIKKARHQQLTLYAWTINQPTVAMHLKLAGFSGIFTDKLSVMQQALKNKEVM